MSRVMAGYVYGITATDPDTFAAASEMLTAVALLTLYSRAAGGASRSDGGITQRMLARPIYRVRLEGRNPARGKRTMRGGFPIDCA